MRSPAIHDTLAPVYETVRILSRELPKETTLIGFAGSPWTVGVYAIEGRGGTDKADSRKFGYQHPQELDGMLEQLVEASAHYLKMQADAGAEGRLADGLARDLQGVGLARLAESSILERYV